MLDSRIIDLNFNKIFLKQVLGEEIPLTIASLKVAPQLGHRIKPLTLVQLVDIDLANSLAKLQSMAVGQKSNDRVSITVSHLIST